MLLPASAGVWLFYIQHQFENTVWAHDDAWNLQAVARYGSSHYALPSLRQYRHSSHPSFVQPNSLLPTAARATRLPGARGHRPAHPTSEPEVCATRAVGRRPKAPRLFPRGAPALRFSLKAMQSTVDNHRTLPRPFWRCGGSRGEELLRDARTGPEEEASSISVAQFRTPSRAYVFPRRWKGGFRGSKRQSRTEC